MSTYAAYRNGDIIVRKPASSTESDWFAFRPMIIPATITAMLHAYHFHLYALVMASKRRLKCLQRALYAKMATGRVSCGTLGAIFTHTQTPTAESKRTKAMNARSLMIRFFIGGDYTLTRGAYGF